METKVCNQCSNTFPFTSEYFTTDNRSKSGLTSKCRSCNNKNRKAKYPQYKEKLVKWKQDHREEHSERKKKDYYKHRESRRSHAKQYYDENKETIRLARKITREKYKEKNREKKNQDSRERYQKVKEHHRVICQRWKQENKELCNLQQQIRRSKKRELPSTLTIEQWEVVKQHFGNRCAYCGRKLPLAQEHFIPASHGGEHTHNNIVPACVSCNSSKTTKSFFEWYPRYKYYSKKREKAILEFLEYDRSGYQQLKLADAL